LLAESGEDFKLGLALAGFRAGRDLPWFAEEHVAYSTHLWLATDPRRVLAAMLGGANIRSAWSFRPFTELLGASIDTEELSRIYQTRDDLLQARDCETLPAVRSRLKADRRAKEIFSACLSSSPWLLENPMATSWVCARYGLQEDGSIDDVLVNVLQANTVCA
jgi:hypothetical protein